MFTKERLISAGMVLLGLLFLLSAFIKGLDSSLFAYTVSECFRLLGVGLSLKASLLISQTLVFAELCAGIGLLLNIYRKKALYISLTLQLLLMGTLSFVLCFSGTDDCRCLEELLPMGIKATMLKDVILTFMTIVLLPGCRLVADKNDYKRLTSGIMMIWVVSFLYVSLFDQPLKDVIIRSNFPTDEVRFDKEYSQGKKEIYAVVRDFSELSPVYLNNFMNVLEKVKTEYDANLYMLTDSIQKDVPKQIKGRVPVGRLSHEGLSALCKANVGIIAVRKGHIVAIWRQNILHPDRLPADMWDIGNQSSFMYLIIKVLVWMFYFVLLLIINNEIIINLLNKSKD